MVIAQLSPKDEPPPDVERQALLMEKQPAARLIPLANVEDADVEVTLSAVVCIPAPKVEVALE